jgi:CHAT domain-containing protein/tetratricopeptide (TPR) repeat protein
MARRAARSVFLMVLLISSLAVAVAAAQENSIQEAGHLQQEAQQLLESLQYQEGILVAKRALAMRQELLGAEHPDVAASLQILGTLYLKAGNFALAESAQQQALALREKLLGPEHRDTATSMVSLADVYYFTDVYPRAEKLYQRAKLIFEKTLGPDHIDTASALLGLARTYMQTAEHDRAEPLFQRALVIQERVTGAESADTAGVLNDFANMYRSMGAHARAKILYRRAIAIREKIHGPEAFESAVPLGNLALVAYDTGDYTEAEAMLKRALRIQEGALGVDNPRIARLLGHLATLYATTGAYSQAELLFRREISIHERAQLAVDTALSLNNLASMYSDMGRPEQAEPLYRRALEIAEKSLGTDHFLTAVVVGNLGNTYRLLGTFDKAEPLLKRAVTMSETALGPENTNTAEFIFNLAKLYSDSGAPLEARPLYRRAITIYERTLGPDHPYIARVSRSLAVLHWARGESQSALSLLQRVQRIETKNFERSLAAGSEARKQDYLRTLTENTFDDVSFSMSTPGTAATMLGLTSVLQHKGRVLDAVSDNVARLRRSIASTDQAVLEQLADVAGQLSSLTYGQGGNLPAEQHRARLTQLSARQEQLEAELASRSRVFSRALTPVTLANIKRAIPADAVLVEWFRYSPLDPKKSGKARRGSPRYVAYVLKRNGEPVAVDIGQAQPVEALARRLRAALADPASPDVKQHAALLSDKLLAPLRVHLRGVEHILFSPDGELNLVPMAALLDESGAYLVERFDVSYLTSGRDLLRVAADSTSLASAVVMADPDYGKRSTTAPANTPSLQPKRSLDLDRGGLMFRPLVGTAREAQDLKALLKLDDASVLLRLDASEANLKRLKGPRILHIASHGFFLSDQQLTEEMAKRRGSGAAPLMTIENPLLRSGIALAGANERSSGDDDGILTALEATQLDLSGTELVVLSACDSGVGEVQNGEGVYGLRRALALAGTQTQITSLWRVSDEATRSLMVDYYRRLLQGEGRSAALRRTQRAMLASATYSHPYYWASFIPIGNWNSLPPLQGQSMRN